MYNNKMFAYQLVYFHINWLICILIRSGLKSLTAPKCVFTSRDRDVIGKVMVLLEKAYY
jgi:hypothetical protein